MNTHSVGVPAHKLGDVRDGKHPPQRVLALLHARLGLLAQAGDGAAPRLRRRVLAPEVEFGAEPARGAFVVALGVSLPLGCVGLVVAEVGKEGQAGDGLQAAPKPKRRWYSPSSSWRYT